jgi:hypothetical protein
MEHVIVLKETGLRRFVKSFFEYYEHALTLHSGNTRRSLEGYNLQNSER